MKHPHGKDLRSGRWSETGRIYHVTTVTAERVPFFSDWRVGRLVVRSLYREPRAETLAFVVMPDHLHWLLRLNEGGHLATAVMNVKGFSSQAINRTLVHQGAIWQAGYHDHALRCDEDLVIAARYIIANPLRAGIVENIGDYPLWDAIWLQERTRGPRWRDRDL